MTQILSFLLLLCFAVAATAQKMVHIPNYLQNPNDVNGAQFTWSKTAQSDNFILIWGNTVGTNPANHPDPNLAFNPARILDTMEFIYDEFKALAFLDDAPGTNLSQYKIPIVMYGTWGANGAQGFANGGDADGVIGAFWVHPSAMLDGGVAAHELAHSLQAQNNIDYRNTHGLGYSWQNAGIFWETHANFMRNLLYPNAVTAWGMDVYHYETWGDWKNTYENYALLMAIMESEGIGMVNQLWRESLSHEYPLQAYKRLAGYTQAQFNDSLFHYARRMATYDFSYNNLGTHFRQKRNADLQNWLPTIQNVYSILRPVTGGNPGRYEIPIEQAPEEFAYNVIPLYPNADSCSVIVKFKGQTAANSHTGWRYGFVAARANGTISRYSPTYSANTGEIAFRLQGDETKMYLVVMGAPNDQITTNTTNDTWRGYPKHFRFPYEVNITGAVPEGYQAAANFRPQLRTNGHLHSNGGGWVQNSATVASSVYVAPSAIVRGNSNISGQVRIEGTAVVRNATMSGNVRILGNAFVDGGTYSQNAKVQGNAFVVNATMSGSALVGMRARVDNYTLSGTVEVGGDVVVYNDQGNCNNGVHYRLTNYYDNKLLECDNRTASHPANSDVNSSYTPFSNAAMAPQCLCAGLTTVAVDSMDIAQPTCTNLASGSVAFHIGSNCGPFIYTWSKGSETGSNLDGLTPGSYSFTITDALDRVGFVPVEIPSPPALTGSVSTTPFDCESISGGTAKVEVTSGTAPFQYEWTNGEISDEIINLVPVEYMVTVTDALGCTFTATADIQLAGQITAYLAVTSIDCTGNMGGGAISIVNFDGTAPYWYQWSNGETTAALANLSPNTYTVTATDALGCTFTGSTTVGLSGELAASVSTTPISCFGGANGSAAILPQGGTPPFDWLWEGGQTDSLRNNMVGGDYSVTITDASGCTNSLQFTLPQPNLMVLQATSQNANCLSGATGSASIVVSGGTPGYVFNWSNQMNTANITGLLPGSYTATVTDANGCTSTTGVVIASPSSLAVTLQAPPKLCPMQEGTVSTFVTGGTLPYSYLWENADTTASIAVMGSGIHAVTVTDALGCSANAWVAIFSSVDLSLDIAQSPILCHDGTEGTAAATPLTGTAPFTWTWSTGATDSLLTNLGTGNYSVTVVDATGCTQVAQFLFAAPPVLAVETTAQSASCFGGSDGMATVIAEGGTPGYSFVWSNGQPGPSIGNLPSDNYSVSATDANGCATTAALTVTAPPLLTLTDNSQPVSCFGDSDGVASVIAEGGTPGYSFVWSTGQSGPTLENVVASIYAVTVSDANGCTVVTAFPVGSPDELALDTQVPPLLCPGGMGEVSVTGSGGTLPYSYLWNTGATNSLLVGGVGSYSVTVTDAEGCTKTETAEVQEIPLSINPLVVNATSPTAANGAIYLMNIMGGTPLYSYLWSNGSTTLEVLGLLPGDYSVTITDAVGCSWVYSFTVGFEVTATGDKQLKGQATIVPNPSSSHAVLYLEMPQAQPLTVAVTDRLGRDIYANNAFFQAGKNSFALPQGLAAGMYWLTLKDGEGSRLVLRWVVQ